MTAETQTQPQQHEGTIAERMRELEELRKFKAQHEQKEKEAMESRMRKLEEEIDQLRAKQQQPAKPNYEVIENVPEKNNESDLL